MSSKTPDAVLARLREICLALPGSSELLSHGAPAFRTAGRMFAYFRHNHHADGKTAVCLKTAGPDEQAMLIEADPALFSWPSYLGRAGWIAMDLAATEPDWDHVAARVRESHRLAGRA